MSISTTSPITGAAQTGFTTPTYTVVTDVAQDLFSKQYAITALGGTQTGATAQSGADNPFNIAFSRSKVLRTGPSVNSTTGLPTGQPGRNVMKITGRKGMRPTANSPRFPMYAELKFSVPAGAETIDPAEIRAFVSAYIGALSQQSAGIGDTLVTGII